MKFCPSCEVKLRKSGPGLKCPKCGHAEGQAAKRQETAEAYREPELDVLGENEGQAALPTVKIDCEKCGNDEAIWWMLQTRSADEPTTQFYRCTKCRYTWRDYA